jgi:hypothetical protein
MTKTFAIATAALMLCGFNVRAQSYHEYKFVFSGTAYQTNSKGVIVATHITDQTLLEDRARLGNISNLNTISLVYHINGGPPYGDTVDVISNATGQTLTTEFGFYFGSDASLGRTAVTNLLQNQQRRVDYIYTFGNSTYTYANGDSIGAAFTYKDFFKEGTATNAIINGTMSWNSTPTGTNTRPVLCIGDFSLGRPMF